MMLRKKLLPYCVVTLLLLPQPVLAKDNPDACGAVLCLAGELVGGGGGSACSIYIAQYFAIQYWKKGRFKPNPTASMRMAFLTQCKSADSNVINRVNDAFGKRMGL